MFEYVQLAASLEALYSPQWNCFSCINKYSENQRLTKGCKSAKEPYIIEDIYFQKCIGNFAKDSYKLIIRMYEDYKEHGLLPFDGASMEQPAKIMEIFMILDGLVQAKKEQDAEQAKIPDRVKKKAAMLNL